MNIEKTLITFHTGRGGYYNNPGHRKVVYIGAPINSYTDELYRRWENQEEVIDELYANDDATEYIIDQINEGVENDCTRKLRSQGLDLGKLIYTDMDGNPVGLDVDNDGTGEINIDGGYDTTTVMRLEECDISSLKKIIESYHIAQLDDHVIEYCKEKLQEAGE